MTVSSISRERKWHESTVKEYQRKDEAQIKLKSIIEAAKSIRLAIPKQVNIKGPQAKSKKAIKPFKGSHITVNAHQSHSRAGDQIPKHGYG